MKLPASLPMRSWPTAMMREALALYSQGYSSRAVTAELRRRHETAPTDQAVYRWAKAAGILRSRSRSLELAQGLRRRRNYDKLRRIARELACEKLWSARRIAIHLKVSRGFVTRSIPPEHRLDIAAATTRRFWQAYLPDVEARRARRDEVITRRRNFESLDAIAATTGLHKTTVLSICREAGLVGVGIYARRSA